MNLDDIGTILAIVISLGTIAGLVFALGQRDANFRALEARCSEEREKNSEQHKEFYEAKNETLKISTRFEDVARRLEKVEEGIDKILSRLPERRGGEGV